MSTLEPQMYVLYGHPIARSVLVEAVLCELDLPYSLVEVDILHNAHSAPEFRQINPVGLIPTLVTPDHQTISETLAICLYLAEQHPESQLVPDLHDPTRARFLSRMFYISNQLDARVKALFYPKRWSTDPGDGSRIHQKSLQDLLVSWKQYDEWLEQDGPYALGDRFSLLDIYMALWVAYGLEYPEQISNEFPAVECAYQGVCRRPGAGEPIRKLRALIVTREGKEF